MEIFSRKEGHIISIFPFSTIISSCDVVPPGLYCVWRVRAVFPLWHFFLRFMQIQNIPEVRGMMLIFSEEHLNPCLIPSWCPQKADSRFRQASLSPGTLPHLFIPVLSNTLGWRMPGIISFIWQGRTNQCVGAATMHRD